MYTKIDTSKVKNVTVEKIAEKDETHPPTSKVIAKKDSSEIILSNNGIKYKFNLKTASQKEMENVVKKYCMF